MIIGDHAVNVDTQSLRRKNDFHRDFEIPGACNPGSNPGGPVFFLMEIFLIN
jgi:hypothetical protein